MAIPSMSGVMDDPAFPGCLLKCRPIGVTRGGRQEGRQGANDRVVAIEESNHRWAHVHHIDDLGKQFVKELEDFFVNYHELSGKKYEVIDVRGPGEAWRRIKDCLRKANGRNGKKG